jgi:hypothetical protein
MNAQEIVAANVAARGYRDGWTAEQFVARQLCKLTEELAEGACNALLDPLSPWLSSLSDAGVLARKAFDRPHLWVSSTIFDFDALRSELADMQVVLFAAAAALDFDVVQAAIDKSGADVARGVR